MAEIKPCPFCGGKDIRFDKHFNTDYHDLEFKYIWSMACYDCGSTFPNTYNKEELLKYWNRRFDDKILHDERMF
jgi:Lar family restriction alleviation protein